MSAPHMTPNDFAHLGVGEHRIACPHCAKGRFDRTLGITIDRDRGVWHCFRCDWTGAWSTETRTHVRTQRLPELRAMVQRHLTLATHWRSFWRDLEGITRTGFEYLSARMCAPPPKDGDLRSTDALRHPSGYVGAALVALVTDAITGEPLTLHRTWIKADGTKADVDPPRMLLGKHRKQGGVIRLWPDDAVTTSLAIGEGIETMLTVALAHRPVWSAIDAGNLAAFPVLGGIESLLIVADHDDAGLRAAEQCAERWYRAGREVRIAKSPMPGEDLNDYVRRAA